VFKVKFRSGVHHLEFLLAVRSCSIPNCHLDRNFKNLTNDVLQAIFDYSPFLQTLVNEEKWYWLAENSIILKTFFDKQKDCRAQMTF